MAPPGRRCVGRAVRPVGEHVFVSVPAILHADLDAFFASVEQRDDPRLLGRPVIVGGGVVLAASYEARACGVRSAMGGGRARQLCPEAVVVRPRFSAYVEASRAVFAILDDAAPVVEQISIDEAFLDVTGLEAITGTPEQIARRLRAQVRREVGLPISIGAATSKHVAKIASAAAKPDGLLLVAPGAELAFLHPLPVERMWGVGPATQRRLNRHGIRTIGDLARFGESGLVRLLGRAGGRRLHALAENRDPRAVRRGRRRAVVRVPAGARAPPAHARGARRDPRRARRPRHAADARGGRIGGPSCCACASATTRGSRARARSPGRRRSRGRSSPRCAGCSRPRSRRSSSAGSPCSASR